MGRRTARALLIVAVFALLAALSISQSYLSRQEAASSPSSSHTVTVKNLASVFWAGLRYYFAWALVTPGILWLARRFPLASPRWHKSVAFHLLVPFAGSVPFIALVVALNVVTGESLPPLGYLFANWWRIIVMVALTVLPVYWLILGVGTALQVYRDLHATEVRAVELRRSLKAAELDGLRMKMHPHFLFNTLNTVASLARTGATEAVEEVIERLGSLLRMSMETSGRQLVTLGEELALVDERLAIEQIRFEDRLHVVRRVDPESNRALVPNLILQPIIENAIAHGFSRRLDASLLEISARRDGQFLRLVVRDDGPGLPPGWRIAADAGRGLQNVVDRLRALYSASFRFDVTNCAAGGTIAELCLPFSQAALPAAPGSRSYGPNQDDHR